jgi:hypothetical protein
LDQLKRAVQQLGAKIADARARGDEVVFYLAFSGHGAVGQDGEAFLVLLDASLKQQQLRELILEPLAADYSHLLIDACHAGGVVGVRGMFERELDANTVKVTEDEKQRLLEERSLSHLPGVGVVIATTTGEEAHEWSRLQAGVFTHELISGLMGGADVNEDGQVDYLEIQAFVAAANREVQDPRAVPKIIARPPRRNLKEPLLRLDALSDTVFLRGDPGQLGHFHVELDNGQRLFDAHLQGFRDVRLALPANRKLFVRTTEQEVELHTASNGQIAIAELQLGPRQQQARGSIDAAYRTALFASPFSATYYRGYLDSQRNVAPGSAAKTESIASPPVSSVDAGSNWLALGSAAVAAIGLGGMAVGAVLAALAYTDYTATDEQAPAYEANQRFTTYAITAGAFAGVALLGSAGALGALLQEPDTEQ